MEKTLHNYCNAALVYRADLSYISFQSFLVAIAVPDAEVLQTWAKSNGLEGDIKQLCQDEVIYTCELKLYGRKENVESVIC